MVYLDYNATAPTRPEVIEAVSEALSIGGNASSVHGSGRRARAAIETARRRVADLAGVDADRVVFTSGGTEANNLALRSVAGRHLVSAVEHPSVMAAAGEGAAIIPVDGQGVLDLDALERQLAAPEPPAIVSVMAANNETGVVQPIAEIARLARAVGARVHCDAVQAAGRIPLATLASAVDLMTISAHKIGGPQGVGALIVAPDLVPAPILAGGAQERGWRGGTENLAGIVGFGVAAARAAAEVETISRLAAMRDALERQALAVAPAAVVLGAGAPRVANTSCLAMPGMRSETLVIALDLAGIEVSAGAACSSGKVTPSHVLGAMGVSEAIARCAIRVSLGWRTQGGDIDAFVDAWRAIHTRAGAAHGPVSSQVETA